MCGKLDHYLQLFSALRTDKNRNRWSAETCFQAPHKPFLLLSILDAIAASTVTRNFIEPTFELAETFAGYWSLVMPLGSSGSLSLPFYHLQSSGFWHLVSQPGIPHERGRAIGSVRLLRKFYLGARFDDDLFPLLVMETSREKLRSALIETYFSPAVRQVIIDQAVINRRAVSYERDLLTTAERIPLYTAGIDQKPEIARKVRDQGFRKAIVKLYEHRCALCGIRMLTPEGHTIVEAAHIVPWNESCDDRPQNGLALCRLCHWSFDEGLMGVGQEYEVLISSAVRQDNNFPGHMETLSGRGIFRPRSVSHWPGQDSLAVHRQRIFRKA